MKAALLPQAARRAIAAGKPVPVTEGGAVIAEIRPARYKRPRLSRAEAARQLAAIREADERDRWSDLIDWRILDR